MSERVKSSIGLLRLKCSRPLTEEEEESLMRAIGRTANSLNLLPMCPIGIQEAESRDVRPLIERLLEEQAKTNSLLNTLIESLAEESDSDTEPTHYLDGTPRCL
ncbi:hypothetical protein D9M68_687390 [compost metagenome]